MKKVRIFGVFLLVCLAPVFTANILAETGNMTIQGSVPTSMSLTVPSSVQMPSLVPGTSVESAAQTVTINTNTSNWTLTVAETGGENDGYMAMSNYHKLTYPIQICGGDLTSFQSLGTSTLTIKSGGSGPATISDIYFRQPVAVNETVGTYSIILMFTATASN